MLEEINKEPDQTAVTMPKKKVIFDTDPGKTPRLKH
jgi:hypothetical protein